MGSAVNHYTFNMRDETALLTQQHTEKNGPPKINRSWVGGGGGGHNSPHIAKIFTRQMEQNVLIAREVL
jgi:hypothetical protein